MSVFDQYDRLEATGIWRESPDAAPREVLVQFGNSTLVLTDFDERHLGHWALAGVQIVNETNDLTTYSMTSEGAETLAISDRDMITAIASVNHIIPDLTEISAPRRKLPWLGIIVLVSALTATAYFAPGVVRDQAIRMVPKETAIELGDRMLLGLMENGATLCTDTKGQRALDRIGTRLSTGTPEPRLRVAELADIPVFSLPGPTIVLSRSSVEQAQSPDELAGWIQLALNRDPVSSLMANIGFTGDIRYIMTGQVRMAALAKVTEALLTQPTPTEASLALTDLTAQQINTTDFANALLRRGLPGAGSGLTETPVLSPTDWRALKEICS